MSRYIATLRAFYDAPDPATALMIADKIRENGSSELDEEVDGDELNVVQVTDLNIAVDRQEVVDQLKAARNLLISLKMSESYELARELDKLCHALHVGAEYDLAMGTYSYSNFMEVAESILKRGELPND